MTTPTVATVATGGEDATNVSNLSVSRLIAAHSRERLFVHPLLWTTRHLSLLRCQFLNLGVLTILAPPPPPLVLGNVSTSDIGDGDDAAAKVHRYLANIYSDTNVARRLATSQFPVTKGHALSQLLLPQRLTCHGHQVRFHYARRTVAQLPCCAFSHPRQSPRRPAAQVAYLDLSEITHHRKTKLQGPAPAHRGGPGYRRVQKLLQRLAPADPCEDPYLVALLIAMSQEQRMDREVDGDNNGEGAPVLLLATLPADANWLHIYASNLSAEFLDRLDHPSSPLLPATVVPPATIYRRRLAFEPHDTLSQRLAAVVADAHLVMDG